MKKALLAHSLPILLFSGCTLVFGTSDPEPAPHRVTTAGAAGTVQGSGATQGEAGAPGGGGEAGAGTVQAAGSGGQGGAVNEDPAGGHGGAVPSGEGLGTECEDASTCMETAPACPPEAGYCTFFCDEAWVNGWQAVPSRVAKCLELGGECTPIGAERSYCVP